MRMHPYYGRISSVLAQFWERPDVESMPTTTSHNHRSLGPLFPADHTISSCYLDPFRFDYNETINAASVITKNMCATASDEIPNAYSPIVRTTDEDVLQCG